MKNIILITALFFSFSTYTFATTPNKIKKEKIEKEIKNERALMREISKTRPWFFETSTNKQWSAVNLAYGPVEILTGVFTPILGAAAGVGIGIIVPNVYMKKGCEFLWPVTIPCCAVAGATCGLAMTPVCAIEGLFNTLTFGLLADDWFAWINAASLKEVNVSKVEKNIIEQNK